MEIGVELLSRMQDLMEVHGPVHAAYLTLLSVDPSMPEPTDKIAWNAKQFAVMYYAQGPATAQCPYFRQRSWIHGYASAVGVRVSFPHVDIIIRS